MTHPCPDSFVMHGVTFRKVRDDGPSAATYQAVDRTAEEWLYCPRGCTDTDSSGETFRPVRLVPGQRCPECRQVAL